MLAEPFVPVAHIDNIILPSLNSSSGPLATTLQAMDTRPNFASRRLAAEDLPTFALPLTEDLRKNVSCLPPYESKAASTGHSTPSVENKDDPLCHLASDSETGSSSASGPGASVNPSVNGFWPIPESTDHSGSSRRSAEGILPHQPGSFWLTPNQPSSGFTSAPPFLTSFGQSQQPYMGSPLYSPSISFSYRDSKYPTAGEGRPPPPYDINLPALPDSMSSSDPSRQESLQVNVHPSLGQASSNHRPFRCDQCQQSFNRNHDLKRHKRTHLAIKPFPCGHCDKFFMRKDALKVRCHGKC